MRSIRGDGVTLVELRDNDSLDLRRPTSHRMVEPNMLKGQIGIANWVSTVLMVALDQSLLAGGPCCLSEKAQSAGLPTQDSEASIWRTGAIRFAPPSLSRT